jgi:hypothetical protein
LCPRCGGAIIKGQTNYWGRRCKCGHESAVVTAMKGASLSGTKTCCKCGADVTHVKRMKDAQGRYWCYDCGAADAMHRDPHSLVICPTCKKAFAPSRMVKDGDIFICATCHALKIRHHKPSNGKHKTAIVTALILGGVVAVGLVWMYVSGAI